MDISYPDKVAIVTGGSRGIGLSIARELVAGGAQVVITGRKREALDEAAAELGPRCHPRVCHAADAAAAEECVEFTAETFGRIDYLVNNAGISIQWGPTLEVDSRAAAKLVEVNQWAPLHWTQLVWRASMAERGGSIVNISSIGGQFPAPMTGYYNATKAALDSLTRQLAAELAPTVRVNAISPGMIETPKSETLAATDRDRLTREIPLGRFGTGEDIAAATCFLLSDHAAWVTGEVLAVDGGTRHSSATRTS